VWRSQRSLARRASSKWISGFSFPLLTVCRCCTNKITCMRGSGCGKACAACVKAKQHCEGFVGEEKWPVVESTGLGEVTAILRDAVEVLRGIRSGMRSLEEAIDGHYVPVESKEESEGEEVEEAELVEELVGWLEEAAKYCAFWRSKHRRKYWAMVPGKDRRNMEEHMEVEEEEEKEKEKEGDGGGWNDCRPVGVCRLKISTYYFFCSVFVFILFVMAFFLFLFLY
jgi:hypothetical protein